MTVVSNRLRAGLLVSSYHFLVSAGAAIVLALLIYWIWYPYPYGNLSGGSELFALVVMVDVVCGPLLTLILFNPAKSRAELFREIGLVVLVQLAALAYGVWTVWLARPLFLVHEIDRFKVIAAPDVDAASLAALPEILRPSLWSGPNVMAIRPPKNAEERHKVLFESIRGGRDYGERPEFYIPYQGPAALKALDRAKPLSVFLDKYPDQKKRANELATQKGAQLPNWRYLPVVSRQDWIAVLDQQGHLQGFLEGDGF